MSDQSFTTSFTVDQSPGRKVAWSVVDNHFDFGAGLPNPRGRLGTLPDEAVVAS